MIALYYKQRLPPRLASVTGIQPLAQPLVQQLVTKSATLYLPEPVEVLPEEPETNPGNFTTTRYYSCPEWTCKPRDRRGRELAKVA